MRSTQPHNRSRLTMLAGWLFADLFLVLLIAGLAALPAQSSATLQPPPPKPTTTTTPPHNQGLDPHHLDFDIPLTPDDYRNGAADQLVAQVEAELAQQDPNHRLVGFVLIFASDDQGHISRAVDTATDAVNVLRGQSGLFTSSTGLGYWGGNATNDFQFKIFLLN